MLLLLVQHLHYEAFAETFGETDLEDHVVLRLLDGAVGCEEEDVVAAAAVGGVGTEVGGAVVLGHHASFLAGAVAVRHEVRVLLKGAGIDVDAAILVEHRLGFDADVVDEDFLVVFFHCFELLGEPSGGAK